MSGKMRLAKDGKPFDIDHLEGREYTEDEVEVIQYLKPNADRIRMAAEMGKEYVEKTKDLIISCEVHLSQVVLYIQKKVNQMTKNHELKITILN